LDCGISFNFFFGISVIGENINSFVNDKNTVRDTKKVFEDKFCKFFPVKVFQFLPMMRMRMEEL